MIQSLIKSATAQAKIIFYVNLTFSFFVSIYAFNQMRKIESQIEEARIEKLKDDFGRAFENYFHPLQGIVSSFHLAHFNFKASDFRNAALSRGMFSNFEGAIGFGFIRRVPQDEIDGYIKRQAQERPQFKLNRIQDPNTSLADITAMKDLFVIELVEPLEKNREAVGLVVSDERNRREAAIEAMISGKPIVTMPIQLVQSKKIEPGFLLFLPVYETPEIPQSGAEREQQLVGWAYAPLLAKSIVKYLEAQNPSLKILDIREHDEERERQSEFFNEKDQDQKQRLGTHTIFAAGKKWVVTAAHRESDSWSSQDKSLVIFIVLSLFSALLYFYLYNFEQKNKFQSDLLLKTEQKVQEATDELKDQKAFLQKVIDNIPALVGYWDRDLKNKLANKAYFEFYNKKPEDIYGLHLSDLIGPLFIKNKIYFEKALEGELQTFERDIPTATGIKSTLATYIPDKVGHEVVGFFVLVFDVTELKALQEKEKEQQFLLYTKSRLSLLGEMAGGIAHEINNPLTIIKGKAAVMLKQLATMPDDESKHRLLTHLQSIDQTVDRISAIVKGMKSFSRDAEKDPKTIVKLKDIFSEVLNLTSEKIKEQEIRLSVEGEENCQEKINCNKVQIEQVLVNLMSNSIYEVDKLEDKWIKILIEKRQQNILIRVVDAGLGISPEAVEKLMIPFFTTKPTGHGTGLGLSICKGLVESHGGQFYYELYRGNTSFVVELPLYVGELS